MSSLAPSQPYGDILRLVRLVQAPVTGAAAVKQMVRGVYEVVTSKRIMEVVQQPRSSSSEAQVASCVAAVLQCAGWLVAARQAAVLGQPQFLNSLGQCVFCCTAFLDLLPEGRPDLLGAALQVSWGEHVPGEAYQMLLMIMIPRHHTCRPSSVQRLAEGVPLSRQGIRLLSTI
jgi:hypothetical protein